MCDDCALGYTGQHCELCSDGYFGNPLVSHIAGNYKVVTVQRLVFRQFGLPMQLNSMTQDVHALFYQTSAVMLACNYVVCINHLLVDYNIPHALGWKLHHL